MSFLDRLKSTASELIDKGKDQVLSLVESSKIEDHINTIINTSRDKFIKEDDFYWVPDIPPSKVSNVLNSYVLLDEDEQLICIYDNTLLGVVKDSFSFSSKGFYWRQFLKKGKYICYRDIHKIIKKENELYFILEEGSNELLDEWKLTLVDSQQAQQVNELLFDFIENSINENQVSNTLEKWVKTIVLDRELTQEEKSAKLEELQQTLRIDSDSWSIIIEEIISAYPHIRSARDISFFSKITGKQAILDYKESNKIKAESDAKYKAYSDKTESLQAELNSSIGEYGRRKLESLKRTLGVFLSYLERIEQKYKENYYELMDGCDFPKAYVSELGQLNMNNSELLKTATTTGSFAYAAVAGVPLVVKSAVTYLGAASTGTSIATLSGAASTNAILAWLGGGSLAAGGGGVAAGKIVLAGISYTVTGIVAIASTGLVASSIFDTKLTQALDYSCEVDIACEKMEASWVAMDGINRRVTELMDVTLNIYDKCIIQLAQLEPIIPQFNTKSKEHLLAFQKTALLIKSISELARVPLFDDKMNLSGESEQVVINTRKILNTEL